MAMPAMAGLLIVVGYRTFKPHDVRMVWKTGQIQQIVMAITFVASLLIPLQYAVLVGVALAVLLFVVRRSNKVTVKAWLWEPGSMMEEVDAPPVVPGGQVTMLVPYGSLFFATAPLIEKQLPEVVPASRRGVVILVLLKAEDLGSTFITVIERYAGQLAEVGGKLMLASVSRRAKMQLSDTGTMMRIGRENVFVATDLVGESVTDAWYAAHEWLASSAEDDDDLQGDDSAAARRRASMVDRFGRDAEQGDAEHDEEQGGEES